MKLWLPLAYCCAILVFMPGCATTSTPGEAAVVSSASTAHSYDVKILRDTWGVPHIFGKKDVDTAFGLAYAHCEDDFKNIQDSMLAVRSLGAVIGGMDAAAIDYIVHLLGVWDSVNAKYETDLSPEVRAICESYADGVNLYAEEHPEEVALAEVFPEIGRAHV